MPVLIAKLESPVDEAWQEVGRVERLYLYPVKSLAAVGVPQLTVGQHAGTWGQLTDREFIVIDHRGKMITARRYPMMVQIRAKKTDDGHLILSHPSAAADLVVATAAGQLASAGGGEEVELEVWGETCRGRDLGAEAGHWLSQVILGGEGAAGGGLRLVQHVARDSTRPSKAGDTYLRPLERGDKDRPYYADGYPFMMMTRPSVEQLNTWLTAENLGMQVEESRYRPNIYVAGDFPPFAEDQWAFIKIGTAVFRNTSPCTRCLLTTVDPATGEKDPSGQPLKLLRGFRSCTDPKEKAAYGTAPCMGLNLGVEAEGEVRVGDTVYVTLGGS